MHILKQISIAASIIVLSISKLAAQNNTENEIDALMNKVHASGIFNGNILVLQKGKTVYQSSFGYANVGKKEKLNADYRFNIGSIAKEFNAVGIMMLEEQGKLNLDDKVSKYIDSLSN